MEPRQVVNKRKMVGIVLKDKMDKTVVVEVVKFSKHRQYKKYIKTKMRYKAHDENNKCKAGDRVLIMEARPISKDKRWVVKQVLKEEAQFISQGVIENDTSQN